jgi:hypothetical protein
MPLLSSASSGPSPLTPVPESFVSLPSATTAPTPGWSRIFIPTRVRIALIVFALVGIIPLVVAGVLLAMNTPPQRHIVLPTGAAVIGATPAARGRSNMPATPDAGTFAPAQSSGTSIATSTAVSTVTPTATSTITPVSGQPWLQLSLSQLQFQYTQGGVNPSSQAVVLSSSDGSAFSWQVSLSSSPSWLTVAPVQGNVQSSGNGQVMVSIQTAQLTPGTYMGQFSISATSNSGGMLQNSPQTLTVSLNVLAPCVLRATPSHLSFSAKFLQGNPAGQTLTLKTTGGCDLPVTWKAQVNASWLLLSSLSGRDNGSGSSMTVSTTMDNKLGTFTAYITLTATDNNGLPVQTTPQTIIVTLTITI